MAIIKDGVQLSAVVDMLKESSIITIYDKGDDELFHGYVADLRDEKMIEWDSDVADLEMTDRIIVELK